MLSSLPCPKSYNYIIIEFIILDIIPCNVPLFPVLAPKRDILKIHILRQYTLFVFFVPLFHNNAVLCVRHLNIHKSKQLSVWAVKTER